MLFLYRVALCAAILSAAGPLRAAPALTTIQDTLYRADGSRFQGVALIEWKQFEAADSSDIATYSTTVRIINGVLRVQLVPTVNAPRPAYYQVRYNSNGRTQFSEKWAVPPSDTPVRLRDIRFTGPNPPSTVPPPGLTEIPISGVTGLSEELAARPERGLAYTPSRAAVINAAGAIESAAGNPADCVRVDGTTGPCGGGESGSGASFADAETLGGVIDGSNTTFTVASPPNPALSLQVFRNGLLLRRDFDFSLAGTTITFIPAATPQPGDTLQAFYRY